MTTEKLYHGNSYTKDFTATISKITPLADDKWAVVLNRTAFYPESGGQPFDTGFLDNIPVIEVTEDGDDIVHILSLKPDTTTVHGLINWNRRFDHMQQHSGQHILSGAFYTILNANTISFHLGSDSSHIDLDLDILTPVKALEVEKEANEIVFGAKAVHTHWLNKDTIKKFPLRKLPTKDFGDIRLVEIADFDYSTCCGTHVANTGEIGFIKIISWERKNNATRVYFVCGWRGLADYHEKNNTSQQLSNRLSVPIADVFPAVEKQLEKLENTNKELTTVKQELHHNLAITLHQQAEIVGNNKLIIYTLTDAIPNEVNHLAKELSANAQTIALIAGINPEQTKVHLVFASAPDVEINMSQQLKNILPLIDGKGGGNPHSAQGGGSNIEKLSKALDSAKATIIDQIKQNS